jgi:hypothetical protein
VGYRVPSLRGRPHRPLARWLSPLRHLGHERYCKAIVSRIFYFGTCRHLICFVLFRKRSDTGHGGGHTQLREYPHLQSHRTSAHVKCLARRHRHLDLVRRQRSKIGDRVVPSHDRCSVDTLSCSWPHSTARQAARSMTARGCLAHDLRTEAAPRRRACSARCVCQHAQECPFAFTRTNINARESAIGKRRAMGSTANCLHRNTPREHWVHWD